jgi:hypothetical protein
MGPGAVPSNRSPQDQLGARNGCMQVDRLGRPSQANFLLDGEVQAAYRAGLPAQDCDRYLAYGTAAACGRLHAQAGGGCGPDHAAGNPPVRLIAPGRVSTQRPRSDG